MPTPGEHKTVQAWILEFVYIDGWAIVFRLKGAAEKTEG